MHGKIFTIFRGYPIASVNNKCKKKMGRIKEDPRGRQKELARKKARKIEKIRTKRKKEKFSSAAHCELHLFKSFLVHKTLEMLRILVAFFAL